MSPFPFLMPHDVIILKYLLNIHIYYLLTYDILLTLEIKIRINLFTGYIVTLHNMFRSSSISVCVFGDNNTF